MKKTRNWVGALFTWFFKLFPIKKNRIYFIARYGQQYSCNPRAYFEYLYQNHKDEFEFVWCLNDKKIKLPDDVKRTKFMSLRDQYYLHTSKYIVNNLRFCMLFSKRKKQVYIQTWHGGGPFILKKIEKDQKLSFFNEWNSKIDSEQIDILLAGSKMVDKILQNCFYIDKQKIYEIGSPRCDIFFKENDDLRSKIRKKLKIDEKSFVILYAPTFRDNKNSNSLILNNNSIREIFESITKKDVKILYRFHPHLLTKEQKQMNFENFVLNVTNYPEMQDLILVADLLITDVSTCMCDMIIANKPCILLMKDYDNYVKNERGLYFPLSILPFPIFKSEEEMNEKEEDIKNYFDIYKDENTKFLLKFGNAEDGHACERLYNIMIHFK